MEISRSKELQKKVVEAWEANPEAVSYLADALMAIKELYGE